MSVHEPARLPLDGALERVPKRLWTGSFVLAGGRVVGTLATALELVVAARVLDGATFGRFTFLLALALVVEAVADLGTGASALQQGVADEPAFARALDAARRLRRVTALAAGALLVGFGLWIEVPLVWLFVACALPLSRLFEASGLAFQRALEFAPLVGARAVGAVTRALGVVALLLTGVEAIGPLFAAHVAGLVLGNVLVHVTAVRHGVLPARARGSARALFGAALPLGLAALVHQAALYADNVFLEHLSGSTVLGRYNAAARVASFLLVFATNASAAALPWLAAQRAAGALAAGTAKLSAALFLPACFVLGALLPWTEALLTTVFGEPFAQAAASLRVLLLSALVVHAAAGWLTAVVAAGLGRAVLALTTLAFLANLLGNALLVPRYGMLGAALATLGTELLLALGAWRALARAGEAPRVPARTWAAGALLFALALSLSSLLFTALA